jgi:hypothetical protein
MKEVNQSSSARNVGIIVLKQQCAGCQMELCNPHLIYQMSDVDYHDEHQVYEGEYLTTESLARYQLRQLYRISDLLVTYVSSPCWTPNFSCINGISTGLGHI